MNDFHPGAGWREVSHAPDDGDEVRYRDGRDRVRYWVREEPVPPLPTEPYTVIRVEWAPGKGHGADPVRHLDGDWEGLDPIDLARRITGFEVLAEPRSVLDAAAGEYATALGERTRRETAKAVLDRVRTEMPYGGTGRAVEQIAREFGVEVLS